VFFDEFGFSFLEPLATTWARKGKRPILQRTARDRRVLSTAVALTMLGKIYKCHFEGSIKSDEVIISLQHLQYHLSGRWFFLIWDRARTHEGKKTLAYLAAHAEIDVEELPAYAPELNPEEYCHGNVKHYLKNACHIDKTDMRQTLNRGFARLRRRPDLLLNFFHAAGLSVQQLQLT
jgi:transposase